MSGPNILLVSNGFGEAAIAGYLARELLRQDPSARVEHLPLVGARKGPSDVGPAADMPSGGLVAYGNVRNLFRDIRAGLLGLTFKQFGFLRNQRARDVLVAVGDVYCLAACTVFARRPTVFVATAKSQYVAAHSRTEMAIARGAILVFARDEPTAQALRAGNVHARYAGNLMMDGLDHEIDLPVEPEAMHFGVLPGSRADAPDNAAQAVRSLRSVARALRTRDRSVQAFIAIAPSVVAHAILDACDRAGVKLESTGSTSVIARGQDGTLDVLAVRGGFGDLLRASDVVIGQAGTGNEQAAGLGKPVIAWSESPAGKTGWYRMRQQRLLGDALLVLPREEGAFSEGVLALLDDAPRMAAMAKLGRERMGGPGGAAEVAKAVLSQASHKSV